MDDSRILRGTELRYALTLQLHQHGPATISELIEALTWHGFLIVGNPPKSVSDALRWEMGYYRAIRVGRGKYAPGEMPRSTEYRITRRVVALREQARRIRYEAGNSDDDREIA
ncbi:MAG: hypothetical protein ABWY93_10040 [Mycobacterium sp.]